MTRRFLAAILLSLISTPALANETQITCMADNVYHEARGEKEQGKIAVANVVMNRTKDPRFPDTPCAVIKQRSKKVCQFSWVCQGKSANRSSPDYKNSRRIAEDVYYKVQSDVTGGAKYFHNRTVRPSWASRFIRTISIGNHIFYRSR